MTTDVGLLRYLSSGGQSFLPIGFTSDESEAEGQFILDLKEEVLSNGITVIIGKYPPLAAFFGNVHKHNSNICIAMFEILSQGLQILREDIVEADGKLENLSRDKIELWGKPLGIIFYLLYKSYETFGCLILAEHQPLDISKPVSARGKKAALSKTVSAGYSFWYEWEIKLFDLLSQVINQPFNKVLWKDSDTNFLSYLVSACLSLVRHTPNNVFHDAFYLSKVVDVFGHLWKTHKMDSEILRIFILAIDKSEESMRLTTRIAKELADKFELSHICLNILEKTYGGHSSAKFGNTEKALASFLVEMTEFCPARMCAGLPILRNILYGDSSVLRSAVMMCAGTLLAWPKSEDSVTLRKHLTNILFSHSNDTNIAVRAKAIQVLTKLIDDSKLHLTEQVKALNVVSKKVNDKAPSVRKAAISFFKALGTGNPILTKFSLTAIQEKLRKHLENLFTSMVAGTQDDEVILKCVALKFVEEVKSNEYGFEKLHPPAEMDTPDNSLNYIVEQLKGRFYWNACEAFYIAIDKWSGDEIFEQYKDRKQSPALYFVLFKSFLGLENNSENDVEIDLGSIGQSEQANHDQGRVVYYKEIKKLKIAFESSFQSFCRILEIGTPNDRKDTINLIAAYCEDGFIPTPQLTNSLMTALGKVDEKLASDLLDSFFRIFIPGMGKSPKDIAERLVNLVTSMTVDNKERMITLFQEMFKNMRTINDCTKELWVIYNEENVERAKASVYLLGVKGSLDQRYILEWVDTMMSVGLGARGFQDYSLATATCNTLLTMYEHCITKDPDGLYEHHFLFEKLEQFIQYGLENVDSSVSDQDYAELVDVAVRLIYYICNDPLAIVPEIIHCMSQHVFPIDFKDNPVIYEGRIHRYIALAEVLIECHVYFYEVIVVEEIKKRKQLNELKKSQKMGPPPPKNSKDLRAKQSNKDQSAKARSRARNGNNTTDKDSSTDSRQSNSKNGEDGDSVVSRRSMVHRMNRRNISVSDSIDKSNEMEEMLGVGDREFERIRDYLDSLLNEGMMSQIRLHVMHLCKHLDNLSYSTKTSCIGLLTKVMCINSHGMVGTMQFFLELWEKTTCCYLKVELIKAATYINMRFPNSMELCNKSITTGKTVTVQCYGNPTSCKRLTWSHAVSPPTLVNSKAFDEGLEANKLLRHENFKIRVATMDFIIYLCMSEVIKVREYLIASSICLNDVHPPLRDAAQDFFLKMSEKNNIVYNSLPEIITFLSAEKNISQLEYQQTMKFLLTKLKKPNQLAGLIEKLVSRFKHLEPGRPRQDVSHCLSILSYNDKTFRIIEDGLTSYCDKLEDALVFDAFVQIVNNAKKNCTKDFKITVEKFELNLNTWKETCDNREGQSNSVVQSLTKKPTTKTPKRKARRGRLSSDEESPGSSSTMTDEEQTSDNANVDQDQEKVS